MLGEFHSSLGGKGVGGMSLGDRLRTSIHTSSGAIWAVDASLSIIISETKASILA